MTLDPKESAAFHLTIPNFLVQVERFYAGLISIADPGFKPDAEPGLGGQLFLVGELDEAGRALVVAANIAGAASLAATADEAVQKQAVRDGVVDFLVNSLDEALRILRNEIRKWETVAVCVAQAPETVKWEMLERGVKPDLVRPVDEFSEHSPFVSQGATPIPEPQCTSLSVLTWSVADAPAQWLPKLDAIALDCLPPEACSARRWLRLAPRYLGRLAQGTRLLRCDSEFTAGFVEKVLNRMERGEVGASVEIQVTGQGLPAQYRFSPPQKSKADDPAQSQGASGLP